MRFPTFSFSDGTFSNIGQDRVGTTISETMEFTDNVTWMHGKHSLKFGADARRVRYNALMFFQPSDDYGDFILLSGVIHELCAGRSAAGAAAGIVFRDHESADQRHVDAMGRFTGRMSGS